MVYGVIEIIVAILMVFIIVLFMVRGVNITINVNNKYPVNNIPPVSDEIYNSDGDFKEIDKKSQEEFNNMLKGIHDFMTDSEEIE